ncbi:MAG TPA: translesion DNA synthesis-associated protein ImuA [Steroidobacteraceae bacterium]
MSAANETQLQELLAHPSVWRGRSRAAVETISTGFAALDAGLPGGGWPRHGLVEVLTPQAGIGELYLLMPVLASLSRAAPGRWCTWVSPPHEPYAPALESHGIALDRMLVVRTGLPLWALEQALRSGACGMAMAWLPRVSPRAIRRLQLAAEQGRALGVLFRSQHFAHLASPAMLRVALDPVKEPNRHGARVTLIKSRGGSRAPIDLTWTAAAA